MNNSDHLDMLAHAVTVALSTPGSSSVGTANILDLTKLSRRNKSSSTVL